MFDIVAPLTAPQIYCPPLRGVLHLRAPLVMAAVPATRTIPMWQTINRLAAEALPEDYDQRKFYRLSYWRAVQQLLKVKLLFRHRGLIARQPIAYRPKPRLCIVRRNSIKKTAIATVKKTQSAQPSPAIVSAAAHLIAIRPRKPRTIGVFHGESVSGNTFFRLPDGRVRPAEAIGDGKIIVCAPQGSGRDFDEYPDGDVVRVNNPWAVILGRLRRGTRERPSSRKAEAARRNGRRPCRPGKHRGRPRKAAGTPPRGPTG
jgi:hypothetical protein